MDEIGKAIAWLYGKNYKYSEIEPELLFLADDHTKWNSWVIDAFCMQTADFEALRSALNDKDDAQVGRIIRRVLTERAITAVEDWEIEFRCADPESMHVECGAARRGD